MKRFLMTLLLLISFSAGLMAADYPANWKSWTKVNTALGQIGALPGCDADVSSLPAIYRETVAIYCAVKPGGPGKVEILVNPKSMKTYAKRNGKFKNGPQMILHLIDLKALMVTLYKNGVPYYKVYTEAGKDITGANAPLAANTCVECHTGYQAFCINGQCGTKN